MIANATNGKVRQIAGQKVNTADVVNAAIEYANVAENLDTEGAVKALQALGHTSPAEHIVETYAFQMAILAHLEQATRAACTRQIGKWKMDSAQAILSGFDHYLNRRIQGQRSRWNK